MKNLFISTTLVVPLLLAFLYGRMGMTDLTSYFMVFNITFTMIGTYVQAALIAEEKEKNTLRGLMLSPASTLEILIGKSLLTIIFTTILLFLAAYLMNYSPPNMLIMVVAMFISIIFYIGLGTVLGLLTRSVTEASVAIMPFIFFFSFGSIIMSFAEEYPILKVVEYMPNVQIEQLAVQLESGAGWGDNWSYLAVIAAWVIGIFIATIFVYRKKMIDH